MRRLLLPMALVIGVLLATGSPVHAHEHRQVGDYELVVGFLNEPALVEEPNGLDLRVRKGGEDGTPVEGLEQTLQAEVIYGDQAMPLELRPTFGAPGSYQAEFIPTAEGAYTFHIFGTIEGTPIDERFTSGPETFSEVESRSALTFPVEVAPVGDVAATAEEARDAADTAMLVGIAGLAVGALGLAAGVAGLVMARGARAALRPRGRAEPREAGD